MARGYEDAVAALNTLQSNFSVVDAIRKTGRVLNKASIPEMIEWCRRIGYEPADFDRLNPIHIAGTKGKGSTSAFVASILSQYRTPPGGRLSPTTTGLYTSPHLRFVRERIQINDAPLPPELFAQYFFETWDRLEAAAQAEGRPADATAKPVYFRFLTLMALHAYVQEGIDTAVIEAGIGGEYDCTNVLRHPTVTGITTLGIDHVAMLGQTIEEIAWHKAGIMKRGSLAFTVPQPEAALRVLRERAAEKGVHLEVVQRHADLEHITLGLGADFQKTNASLAVAVAAAHLRAVGHTDIPTDVGASPLPSAFRRGLEQARWSGRCETRRESGIAWCIDGGHTMDSIRVAGEWFAAQVSATPVLGPIPAPAPAPGAARATIRALIFNQQTRDADALATALYQTLAETLGTTRPFTHVIFCSNVTWREGGYSADLVSINTSQAEVDELRVQKQLAVTWAVLEDARGTSDDGAKAEIRVVRTIQDAVEAVRAIAPDASQDTAMVLVTGSLHLVGGFLEVLEGA